MSFLIIFLVHIFISKSLSTVGFIFMSILLNYYSSGLNFIFSTFSTFCSFYKTSCSSNPFISRHGDTEGGLEKDFAYNNNVAGASKHIRLGQLYTSLDPEVELSFPQAS